MEPGWYMPFQMHSDIQAISLRSKAVAAMREPHLGQCHITGRKQARQSLFLDDLMPVWARFSFMFSNLIRTRCRLPFFEFPLDIDILPLSLDLHDCRFVALK